MSICYPDTPAQQTTVLEMRAVIEALVAVGTRRAGVSPSTWRHIVISADSM